MMLDAKRTFDEIIERLAPDDASRQEILSNPVYGELSDRRRRLTRAERDRQAL